MTEAPVKPTVELPPTINDLYREVVSWLRYEPETGRLFWTGHPTSPKPLAGKPAGSLQSYGYMALFYRGKFLLCHRVAWLIHSGDLPEQVDHINGNKADNRLANLRPASNSENSRNRGAQSNNTSGFKGVSFHKSTGKYRAAITSAATCGTMALP